MELQVLVSTMFQSDFVLVENMNLPGESIVINQADSENKETKLINGYSCTMITNRDRGIGKSRNLALSYASAEYLLFADDDIQYYDNCRQIVIDGFERHPDWDILIFELEKEGLPKSYRINKEKAVRWYNYQRYGAAHMAVRRRSLENTGIAFSLEFGGGAPYACGEDSIFLHDCMKMGMTVGTVSTSIGILKESESTWFRGYNDKYFLDRGRLYWELNGHGAWILCLRYAWKKRKQSRYSFLRIFWLMKKGSILQCRKKEEIHE